MTHIQHIHTCSDAWILRLFAFDFFPTAFFYMQCSNGTSSSFHLSATMKIFGTPCRFFSWVLSNCRFRKSIHYQTRVPESRWRRHAYFLWLTSPQENAWRKTQTPKMVVLWATIRKPAIVIGVAGPQLAGAAERATTRALMPAAAQTLLLVMGIDYDAAWESKSTN